MTIAYVRRRTRMKGKTLEELKAYIGEHVIVVARRVRNTWHDSGMLMTIDKNGLEIREHLAYTDLNGHTWHGTNYHNKSHIVKVITADGKVWT